MEKSTNKTYLALTVGCVMVVASVVLYAGYKNDKKDADVQEKLRVQRELDEHQKQLAIEKANTFKETKKHNNLRERTKELRKNYLKMIESCYEMSNGTFVFSMQKYKALMKREGFTKVADSYGDYTKTMQDFIVKIEMGEAIPTGEGWDKVPFEIAVYKEAAVF